MARIETILKYESESHLLDYKSIPYDLSDKNNKHEFLKDVSAMANNPSDEDKYIVIGVHEKNGLASKFINISSSFDQASYQQFLDSHIEPPINFEYVNFIYESYNLFYLRIFENYNRPYLFKRDLVISEGTNKIKYSKGDGFIRVGTSTRRLERGDLDNMYNAKSKLTDRKSDLRISRSIGDAENDINIYKRRYFDFNIENISNKSIGFDVEMHIMFDGYPTLCSRYSLKKSFIIAKPGNPFEISTFFTPTLPNLDVYVEENESFLHIELNRRKFEKYAMTIPQSTIINDIFQQELIIIPKTSFHLKAQLLLRSDEFIDGPLQFELDEKIELN